MAVLLNFMLFKYCMKEPVTKTGMFVIPVCKDQFSEIFLRACELLEIVFSLNVKEVDPTNHYHELVIKLGLTYYGILGKSVCPRLAS